MSCQGLARIDTHSVHLQVCVEPFCALTVPIPQEFRFPLPPPPVCELSHSFTCIVHAAFISTSAFTRLVVLSNILSISPLIKLMIGLTLSLIDGSESRPIGLGTKGAPGLKCRTGGRLVGWAVRPPIFFWTYHFFSLKMVQLLLR